MEEFENEYDNVMNWVVFFVALIVIAIVGYRFVFNYQKNKDDDIDILEEDTINIDEYKGVWVLYGNNDTILQELSINIADGSTITFDYIINGKIYFESQAATLDGDRANFDITDRDKEINIKGRLVFGNEKISLVITYSSTDDIPLGTVDLLDRIDESA